MHFERCLVYWDFTVNCHIEHSGQINIIIFMSLWGSIIRWWHFSIVRLFSEMVMDLSSGVRWLIYFVPKDALYPCFKSKCSQLQNSYKEQVITSCNTKEKGITGCLYFTEILQKTNKQKKETTTKSAIKILVITWTNNNFSLPIGKISAVLIPPKVT